MSGVAVPNSRVHQFTGKCVGAITARRYCIKVDGGYAQVTTEGARPDCISMFDGADQERITFYRLGIHDVTSGAAVTDGATVMSDNAGRAITYVAGAGVWSSGVCHQTVTAANLSMATEHFKGAPAS
jgi:hypothetical protein